MKKILIATSVAVLGIAVVAAAATFTSNLTVGSTGAEVVALQSALIAGGYSIPAVQSGAAAKGYFGTQTKSAVQKFQAANGVPSTGFVGPLTRAVLNGGSVATTPVTGGCPIGYTCTLNTGTVVNNTTGSDGSVSVTTSTFVSTGANLKKGDTKDVVAVKLQATAGPVTVTRLDAHFNVRPWLIFSQATLKDSTGKVLATIPLSNPANVTEVTVGSDYLVRFEGLNFVVTPGTNPDLAVGVTVLAATDKITDGQQVKVAIPSGAIRTVNGLGINDSVGGDTSAFPTTLGTVGASTFTLSSTGSVADISTRLSPVSPATTRSQVVSATVATNDVVLAVFSLKAQNNSATVNNMNFTIQTDPAFTETGLFSNIRVKDGSTTYGALSFSTTGLATFTNLNIPLAQDQWKDLTLVADVAATSTNVSASSTLDASTISAVDANYNNALVGGVAMASATNDQTGANVLLTINSMSVSGTSAAAGTGIADEANGPVQRYPVSYTFTLTNNSNNSLYVPADVSLFVGTSTTPTNASSTITLINPVTPVAGDTATTYIIPSGGGSRTFTLGGVIKKSSNTSAAESLRISSINYGTNQSTGTGASPINTGLEGLFKLVNF